MSASIWGPGTFSAQPTGTASIINVKDYPYFAKGDGVTDDTAAIHAARDALKAIGGGYLYFPYGDYRANIVINAGSIWLVGSSGRGEFDEYCVRPYNMSLPAVTFGDGTTLCYYNGIDKLHVSGTDGSAGAVLSATGNAPQALLLKGGVYKANFRNCVFYNGIQTVAAVPTNAGQSISAVTWNNCDVRNDLTSVATARAVYLARYEHSVNSPDLGYLTAVRFTDCKINGPKLAGYALQAAMLGDRGITVELFHTYIDHSPGCGVKLEGSSAIVPFDLQLDPGALNEIVIETDQTGKDLTRYISGQVRHGGQIFKTASGNVSMPAEADFFFYRPLLSTVYVEGLLYFTNALDPYGASGTVPYLDQDTSTGPITLNLSDFSIKTAGKGLRVREGSNAKQGTAVLVAGTVTVANTAVTANSRIFLTSQVDGGTPGFLRVSARVAGTSFTITSSNGADTSTVAYQIFEPA